jgi:hypothetical protein
MSQASHPLLRLLVLGLGLLALQAGAVDSVETLNLCITSEPHPPFSDPRKETPIQQRIRTAAATQGFAVAYHVLPWRRCMQKAHGGQMDGAVGLGAHSALAEGMLQPLQDGEPDKRRALGYMPFVLVRRTGERVDWDGQRLHHLEGPVLIIGLVDQIKYELNQRGIAFRDSARGPFELARMLLAGRGNLALDTQGRVNKVLAQPEFAGRLEVLEKPMGGSLGMLVIAPPRYKRDPQRIEALWDEYARLREAEDGGMEVDQSSAAVPPGS